MLSRSRIWRPALVRAGLLGIVEPEGEKYRGEWTDLAGRRVTVRIDHGVLHPDPAPDPAPSSRLAGKGEEPLVPRLHP